MKNILYAFFIALIISIIAFWYTTRKKSVPIESNTIIVGTNAEYPPFTFMDNNTIVGFDIDIAREVCRRLGKTMELKDMSFDALIPKIQLGQLHMIAAGMTATPERAQQVLFTKPYLTGDPLLIIALAKNSSVKSVNDLHGKEVVVNEGYTADFYMSSLEGPIIKRLPGPADAFLALQSERAYAFVAAQSTVQPFLEQYGKEQFQIVPIEGSSDNYSLVISKYHSNLLLHVQRVLDEMTEDGTLENLKKKWNFL